MGKGADQLILGSIEISERSQPCNIDLGSEAEINADAVWIQNAKFASNLNISTGGGDDVITVEKSQVAKRLTVNSGAGNDTLEITSSSADEVFAQMGAGNSDEVTVRNSRAKKFTMDGGSGSSDKLLLGSGNSIGTPIKTGVEFTKKI